MDIALKGSAWPGCETSGFVRVSRGIVRAMCWGALLGALTTTFVRPAFAGCLARGDLRMADVWSGVVGTPNVIDSGDRARRQNSPPLVNENPVARSGGPYVGFVGVPVAFDASGSYDPDGDSLTYRWDFGDGATGSGVQTQHTYFQEGEYDVVLTVDDGRGGLDRDTTTAYIFPLGQWELEPDEHTVLLDHFNDSTLADNLYPPSCLTYGPSLPGLGKSAVFAGACRIRYDLSPWYVVTQGARGTIEALVRITGDYGRDLIIFQWVAADNPPSGGWIGRLRTTDDGLLYWWTWGSEAPVDHLVGKTSVPKDQWTHVAVTWGEAGTRLYIDGRVDTAAAFNLCPQMSAELHVYSGTDFGYLDELHVSSVQRPGEEIYAHYLLLTGQVGPENSPPTADANGPYVGTVNEPIMFDGSGSSDPDGDSLVYRWSFGDGSRGTGVRTSHAYADTGVYEVVLVVEDGKGGLDADTTVARVSGVGTREIVPDTHTVLLDHFNGASLGSASGEIQFVASCEGLGQAARFADTCYVRYDLTPWYHSDWSGTSPTPEGTIEFWTRPFTYPCTILWFQWYLSHAPPQGGYILGLQITEEGKLRYRFWNGVAGPPEFESKSSVPLEQWTHVAVSWGPDWSKIYLNGRLDTTVAGNAYPAMGWGGSNSLYVYLNGWGGDLGCLDEFHLSRVQRSDEEIYSHFTLVTGSRGRKAEELPREYDLLQNYPNPFNAATTIRFRLPGRDHVVLQVLDVSGREVRTLVNGVRGPGSHVVVWDGKDASGNPVASGIYICRLRAGRSTLGRKMTLIR